MEDAKTLWSIWQDLLGCFRGVFTRPGFVRFVQWVTALVLCDQEHTITQALTSVGQEAQWRNLERMAEYGAWDTAGVERTLQEAVERTCPCRLGRYRPMAVDDTKAQRASPRVWGVCTFKHVSRNPKHPKLIMGHNWVVMGELADGGPDQPRRYLPTAGRLYLRRQQLPPGEAFATKHQLAVQMLRAAQPTWPQTPLLAIFDGGYAHAGVVRPCLGGPLKPGRGRTAAAPAAAAAAADPPRIQVLTRLRRDARLFAPAPPPPAKPRRGRRRVWGERLPRPKDHDQWQTPWQEGRAWVYGKRRTFRAKALDCRWSVSGPHVPVRVYAFEVQGYTKPWFIITSALDLSAAQVLEAYAARFRQEDGIRDHKQRLGMEETRAWTKAPVLRSFQAQTVAMCLLRLLEAKLEQRGWRGGSAPPWNPRKSRASILDLRRLLWRHRPVFSRLLAQMEEDEKNRAAAA